MTVLGVLLDSLRLLTFQRPQGWLDKAGLLTVAALALLELATGSLILLAIGQGGPFGLVAFLVYCGKFAVGLTGTGAIAALSSPRSAGRVALALLATSVLVNILLAPFLIAGVWFATQNAAVGIALMVGPPALGLVATAIVIWRLLRQDGGRLVGLWAPAAAVFCLTASLLLPYEPVFGKSHGYLEDHSLYRWAYWAVEEVAILHGLMQAPAPHENTSAAYDPDTDPVALLGKQPERLGKVLDRLTPGSNGKPALYYVGFAGYGDQAVFRREVQAVYRLLADRFGTEGRGIELINGDTRTETAPLASPYNLSTALARVGKIMDPAKDVLFLYMTSHGSPGRFAVRLDDLPFDDITPRDLRAMLDRAGIKHRVVVISACFSGSFVKELSSSDTLLITAARPDRTSFGCSDERSWTYFGDAYFNHALRQTRSFTEAFRIAAADVADWEENDNFTPSEPQISVGSHIVEALGALDPEFALAGDRR